jgi:hypothetical protein
MTTQTPQDLQIESLEESLDRVYRLLVRSSGMDDSRKHSTYLSPVQPCQNLQRLESVFGLTSFERDLLLLCAGAALEGRFLAAFAAAHGDQHTTWPTFGLALSVLEDPHWSAISRARPLRYWKLIDVAGSSTLHAELRIDEHLLQYLAGSPSIDERLEALIHPLASAPSSAVVRSARMEEVLRTGLRHWQQIPPARQPILLIANHDSTRLSAFRYLCEQTSMRPHLLNAADVPSTPIEREQLSRLWTREYVLGAAAIYIRTSETEDIRNLSAFVQLLETPVAIEVRPGSPVERMDGLRLHLPSMSASERKQAWTAHLGSIAPRLNGYLDRIVEHFEFDEDAIHISATSARQEVAATGGDMGELTWRICRQHARRSLDNLAPRLNPHGSWEDLVLPAAQMESLRQIAIHVRQRPIVNEQWGFAERYERGLGLSALFGGASGTGKTMAAELLAAELDLDLYRIDLASVVSKYIGETEKNLRRIFDAAEESSAILLFDEADALFGKRSEVRDSHDRYANLEISYLLQRMESYRGVAILTTNMQHAIDSAFMRRIRFIVQFPFPDASSRARIWQRVFPAATPLGAVDYERLAQLNVSGGLIRNIAMQAAFIAAEDQTEIGMSHLLAATRAEYSKMDKPLTSAETRGWL